MVSCADIVGWIEQGLSTSTATVEGDGRHFQAVIVCPLFAGKHTVARHRMVYQVLGDRMKEEIHALSLKTYTPAEQVEK